VHFASPHPLGLVFCPKSGKPAILAYSLIESRTRAWVRGDLSASRVKAVLSNAMARSSKKTPIFGIANASDKADKSWANRRERRVIRTRIAKDRGLDALPQKRELSDVWSFAKDGKQRYDRSKSLRK
jgi:hypothetical protein